MRRWIAKRWIARLLGGATRRGREPGRDGEVVIEDAPGVPPPIDPLGEGAVFEQFRSIRAHLLALPLGERPRLLLFTSSVEGEGKSFSVVHLGRAIAGRGDLRVLLLDANLRAPRLHRFAGAPAFPAAPGLVECLRGEAELRAALRPTGVEHLDLLPAGHPPGNPSELLGSDRMRDFLRALRDSYDFVLVDSPSLERFADSAAVGSLLDAALLVVRLNRTARSRIEASLASLRQHGIAVLGCILTDDRDALDSARYEARKEPGARVS